MVCILENNGNASEALNKSENESVAMVLPVESLVSRLGEYDSAFNNFKLTISPRAFGA